MDYLACKPAAPRITENHDLSLRTFASTEWWYIQGRLSFDGIGERSLMVMLLRRRGKAALAGQGWTLLVSVTDPVAGTKAITSIASQSLADNLGVETVDTLVASGMPRELAEAYNEELARYGPQHPIRVSDAPPHVGAGLNIQWEDFCLFHDPEGCIVLSVAMPDSNATLDLTLRPAAPWSYEDGVGAHTDFGKMHYALCPRMTVTGCLGAVGATGEVWFDHQWGGHNWFEAGRDGQSVLGWEWLAINLEDGRDILVVTSRDMVSGDRIESFANLYDQTSARKVMNDIEVRALAHWTSPDTHADYPVAWQVTLPEIDADLVFTPDMDDCEIPIYGAAGAVWEGGGRVHGTIADRQVAGRAHLELFGYALPAAFEHTKAAWIERIDDHIASVLPKKITESWLAGAAGPPRYLYDCAAFGPMLSDPCWTLMSRGGKHWRAVFGILLLRALGTDVAKYEALITTIPEMMHAGSLMIDDIQDHSELRRGGPSIHRLFGVETTINAASTLYFLPLQSIARHPHLDLDQREAIYRVAINLLVEAHLGQAQDLYSGNWRLSEVLETPGQYAAKVLQTCTLKTGAPVRALAEMLCIIARCDPVVAKTAADFAESAGIAYQIMDDVNSFSAGSEWGKELGEDIREGRLTYVILRALEALPQARQSRLAEILADESIDSDAQCEACALVAESGVLEICREEARDMIDRPWEDLSRHLPPSQSKTLLRLMFARLFVASAPRLQN